jgi:LmbE family N-acetylglucosaminyl deacetylase
VNRGNPFRQFVSEQARLFQGAKKPPVAKSNGVAPKISDNAPRALIFSPHPDDECIIGGLALRLLRESKWKIINVAVTLGGKRERKAARLRELKNACDFLGFDLAVAGWEQINLGARKKNRAQWNSSVRIMSEILAGQRPRAIFFPHEKDFHPTHVGAHFLILDALKKLPKNFNCFVVETEFWGQMANPNLLVEVGENELADLIAALSFHAGEIKRNPYHARLPAWMMDNVRRAEIVGGAGGAPPDFVFGTIYRLQMWRRGKLQKVFAGGKFLSAKKNPAALFP